MMTVKMDIMMSFILLNPAGTITLQQCGKNINEYITAKSVADIYYLAHKDTHNEEKTRNILNKLFSLFGVFDTTATHCINASFSKTKDYEVAVMIETAIREKADFIVTRYFKDYSKSSVKVLDPKELIKRIDAE